MPLEKSIKISTLLHVFVFLIIFFVPNFIITNSPKKVQDIEFKLVDKYGQAVKTHRSSAPISPLQPQQTESPQSDSQPQALSSGTTKITENPSAPFQVAAEPASDAIPSSKIKRASSSSDSQTSQSHSSQGLFSDTASDNSISSGSSSTGRSLNEIMTFDITPYISELRRNVKLNWKVPSNSEGKRVELFLRIARDGRLIILNVKTTSEIGELDDSALEAVRRAANPLKPLPQRYAKNFLDIVFTFNSADASVR